MVKLKEIPKVDRPREKFLKKGANALSNTELLSILIGTGIKGKNVKQISEQIIKKFGKNFVDVSVDDLLKIQGIGKAKALQIVAAINLVKRYTIKDVSEEIIIKSTNDVLNLTFDLKNKKKEYLVCLYLNARNVLIKKEIVSIGILNKSLVHPREIFAPAIELRAASVILIHNHPSGNINPSNSDNEIVKKLAIAGDILGINLMDFIIIGGNNYFSFFNYNSNENTKEEYIADGNQLSLFYLLGVEKTNYISTIVAIDKKKLLPKNFAETEEKKFYIQNRRYLGNKFKLLNFIEDIINEKCKNFESMCDIFAGTGVVGNNFNNQDNKIISNDLLFSNFVALSTFLGTTNLNIEELKEKINTLNNLEPIEDNYFSQNYGDRYFTMENARKIGSIRELINKIADSDEEKYALVTSLIYAADKIANTVGHYDAFRKKIDSVKPIKLLIPNIAQKNNMLNEIYCSNANELIENIRFDILFIDPPYNSRQYCDSYHLLENLARWEKPKLYGVARKMNRKHLKSNYCFKNATKAFADLINKAKCQHILLTYNNTGESKDGRSNARINDNDIIEIFKSKGKLEIFEKKYKAFTTGKSVTSGHTERVFYCKVK